MCGVFGIENNKNAAQIVFAGLLNLQHRGQEAAGVAVYNPKTKSISGHVGRGTVLKAFNDAPAALGGSCAVGHVRYATSGKATPQNPHQNTQPFIFNTRRGKRRWPTTAIFITIIGWPPRCAAAEQFLPILPTVSI